MCLIERDPKNGGMRAKLRLGEYGKMTLAMFGAVIGALTLALSALAAFGLLPIQVIQSTAAQAAHAQQLDSAITGLADQLDDTGESIEKAVTLLRENTARINQLTERVARLEGMQEVRK